MKYGSFCSFGIFCLLVLQSVVVSAQEAQVVEGEYLVKFKSSASISAVQGKIQAKGQLKSGMSAIGLYHADFKVGGNEAQAIADLQNDPDVEYIEPNYIYRTTQISAGPAFEKMTRDQMLEDIEIRRQASDSQEGSASYDAQSGSGTYTQTTAPVRATEGWSASSVYSSTNRPIVAVIDTGMDKNHRVFVNSGALWVNTGEVANDGIDNDGNGYVDDINGWNFNSNSSNFADDNDHGTHVAGIVLGATQDIFKTTLDASKIRIMPLKFLNSSGSGSTASAISAIYYAVNNGAKVINNSWGGGSYSRALHDAMIYAYSQHVFVVSAAGNNSKNNDLYAMYPANYDVPSNLSVAASTDFDYLASFSNYGANTVGIAAPGVYVSSTYPGNYFGYMSGTSMAAPFISGLAALAFREAQNLTGYQMKNILIAQSGTISQLNNKVKDSKRVDGQGTIVYAKTQSSTVSAQPGYTPVYSAESSRSPASEDSVGNAAGCGTIVKSLMNRSSLNDPTKVSVFFGLLLLPVLVWYFLASRSPVSRRRYDRYKLESEIKLRVGDRELTGVMKTISLGGMSFDAQEILEKGGVLRVQIKSPAGNDVYEVEGQIVWSSETNSYGVQFKEAEESFLRSVQQWTKNLIRAS
ncbi:MAG: S8 family serine peptidase [Pseudobdellovibrionaceae bacterium]